MAKRVFISKNASEVQELQEFLEDRRDELICHSFLQFEPVAFEPDNDYDVIFFGSPRAVMFYISTQDIPVSKEIACVGGKTAEILYRIGKPVAFNGERYNGIEEVAHAFKDWCGNKTVLFPISDISLKTISSQFDSDKKKEQVIYSTKIKGKAITECDVYVFTSPSNVKGYFKANQLPQSSTVFAWGESTAQELHNHNCTVDHILEQPSIASLIKAL